MANWWTTLKEAIASVIKTNGNQEITGQVLQNTLNSIVNSIGENYTLAGIATPATSPGTFDGPVFYIAGAPGLYSNFNNYIHTGQHCIIFCNTQSGWSAIDTGIPSNISSFIFSKDIEGVSAYIQNIVFEVDYSLSYPSMYKPDGSIRKFAFGNIDATDLYDNKGRIVIYREDDNGELKVWVDNFETTAGSNTDWITTKIFTTTSSDGVKVSVYFKNTDIPYRLYPIDDRVEINNSVILTAVANAMLKKYDIDIKNLNNILLTADEILNADSKFDENSVYTSTHVGDWTLRYTNNANSIEKISDGFKISLDKTSGNNPAIWIINKFNAYIGKTINISGKIKLIDKTSIILYTNTGNLSETQISASAGVWTDFNISTIIGSNYADARVMFYFPSSNGLGESGIFYLKDISISSEVSIIEDIQTKLENQEKRITDIEHQVLLTADEILNADSKFDENTPIIIEEGIAIGAGSDWKLRFPSIGANAIQKIDNSICVTLDGTTNNSNAALWALNLLNEYVGKKVQVKFEVRKWADYETTSNPILIIGGSTAQKIITLGDDWTEYDYTAVVANEYGDTRVMFYTPSIAHMQIRNISISYYSDIAIELLELNIKITDIEEKLDHTNNVYTENTPNILAKIGKNIFENSGVMNIGLFGDSWTHGVGSVSTGLITYAKYIARMLWEKYGYAGLGWFDFGYSNNTDMKCADDEAINLIKSGNFTYLSKTPSCLGINIAHTVFSAGASYTLQLVNENRPIDKGTIWFYSNAKFSIAINDESASTITGIEGAGWQSHSVTGDITKITITAITESIIFGIDLSYGNKGVKVHKLGNRGLTTSQPLQVDIENWQSGLSKLNLDFFSVLLFTNDRSGNVLPSTVAANIERILGNVAKIYPTIDKAVFAPSETRAGTGTYSIEDYTKPLRDLCIKYKLPFLTFSPIFGSREQIIALGTFYDSLHPSKTGDYLIAEYIFKHLFEYYQYK